ncbi:MAG: succinylglutamate desuccinylase/aspartoacylase family protein [Cyclobacteriaceae bacterium]
MEPITIAGQSVEAGKEKQILAVISKLPTRTEIEIPIIVSRSKNPGPTLLLMGGMHGDEINGVEIVRRIISKKYHRPAIGTVICIPIFNVYGFLNFSRQVPDGKDVNRSFPGTRSGSLASQLAYHLRNEILPAIDLGLDFHTGGARINNYPQIRGLMDNPYNLELAKAFGAKYIINSPLREKSLRKEASKINKSILVYEAGESLRLRKHAIDEGVNGALRVMKHLGMRAEAPDPSSESIILAKSKWIRARAAGLYYSFVRSGQEVEIGQKLGLIAGPFGEFERPLKSTIKGHVIAVNNNPVVNRGDALMHIGEE